MAEETFGEALRRIRLARGLSLRQLNRAAHVDFGLLSRIENGKQNASESVAGAVDRALCAGGELVSIKKLEAARATTAAVPFDPMRRRTLMTGAVGTAFAGLVPSDDRVSQQQGRLGAADADRLQLSVVRLYALDYQHGGESLWPAAMSLVSDGYAMLEHGTYSAAVEHQLLKATGRMQMCAGWLAFDSGRQDMARSCYTEALALAKQAGDSEVETHALANLAFQANVLGMPRQARRFADAAERAASTPGDYARLPIIPQLRLALSSALSGDRTESDRAMTRARKILDRHGDKPAEEWCAFLSPAELDGLEGTCATELGQTDKAMRLLEQSVAAHGDQYARNRALYSVRLARARLDASIVDDAADSANAALDDLRGAVTSWRVSNELRAVAARFAPFAAEPAAARFLTRYAQLAN
jgi:tetratricopeptide (TPR) repeat protein